MKKKWLLGILSGLCALTCMVGFSSCGHTHAYTDEVTNPTCTEQGYTTHTCECGEMYKDTYVNALGHNYVDGVCIYCAKERSEGLAYELSGDGTHYIVTGIGTCTDTEVFIPKKHENKPVLSIGNSAFRDSSSLTSVVIPNGVLRIGDYAFSDCDSLTSVTIGNNVTSVGIDAFYNCNNLQYTIENNCRYLGNGNNPYLYLVDATSTSITTATINENCKIIGSFAFSHCASLTEIVIGGSVTSIGEWVFAYCYSLTSVTFGENSQLTSIGDYALYGCSSLTSIVIGGSVTSIGDGAFQNCTILTIYCEAESQPSGWDSRWNYSNRPVVWGYKGE